MNNYRKDLENLAMPANTHCTLNDERHCITCSDEAIKVYVVSVDNTARLARVALNETAEVTEEIDITLVEDVTPGDSLLAHGGVAIAQVNRMGDGT